MIEIMVETSAGDVCGTMERDVCSFKGIHMGRPPVVSAVSCHRYRLSPGQAYDMPVTSGQSARRQEHWSMNPGHTLWSVPTVTPEYGRRARTAW